jgi:hypothetical protein
VGFEILAQAHSNAWRSPAHIDHHGRLLNALRRQPSHHPREDAFVAPAFPAAVERLVRAVFHRGAQPIAIDKDNPTQHAPIIDAGLTVGLWEEWFKTRHLRIAQPEKVAHVAAPFLEP